jgi:DNA polymerase-1
VPTLALIDGNSVAYRAFYALPPDLATKSGQVTNAVFGFTRMLIRLLKDYHPEGIAVAWDISRQTFRTESFPEYKSQRERAPEEFRSQLPLMDEVLQTLRITQLRQAGYEADDLIATLVKRAVEAGWEVLIVTGDRDAFQLIEGPVRWCTPDGGSATSSWPMRRTWRRDTGFAPISTWSTPRCGGTPRTTSPVCPVSGRRLHPVSSPTTGTSTTSICR